MSGNITFCDICNISFLTANDSKTHFVGKKHKKKETILKTMGSITERTIHVSRLPSGTLSMQLQDYFSTFGPVSKVTLNKNTGYFAFVEFTNKETQQACLNQKTHYINKRTVKVNPSRKKVAPANIKLNTSLQHNNTFFNAFENNHECVVMPALLSFKSLKDQIMELQHMATLSLDDIKSRKGFCMMIQNKMLRNFFPNCIVEIYGSTTSGFGFKGCDMDISIEIPEYPLSSSTRAPLSTAPSVNDINQGIVAKEDLLSLPKDLLLNFLKKVFAKIPKCICIMVIPSTRCPILRFQYTQLKISCDVNINKELALVNTKLLKYYGRLDARVRPLILALRYWAKLKNILGGSGQKLTSYAFSWLVIFFLQSREPPVVPSFESLQNLAGEESIVEGYNAAFIDDNSLLGKSENKETMVELIKEFFNFYFSFDFTMNAVCPRTGKAIDRTILKDKFLLNKNFKFSPMTIQDPIEEDRNIGLTANSTSVIEFLEEVEQAIKTCQLPEFESSNQNNQPHGLMTLFTKADSKTTSNAIGSTKRKLDVMEQETECYITFTDKMIDTLRSELKESSSKELIDEMYRRSCDLIKDILGEGLLITCSVKENAVNLNTSDESEPSCKRAKLSNDESSPKTDLCSLLMELRCEVYFRTWNGRKQKKLNESFAYTPLEHEKQLSNSIVREQRLMEIMPEKPFFDFEVHLFRQNKGAINFLKVSLVQITYSKEFKLTLIPFLMKYIPKLTESCLTFDK